MLEMKSSSRLNTSPSTLSFTFSGLLHWTEDQVERSLPEGKESLWSFENKEIKGMRQDSRVSRRACKSYGFSFPVVAEAVAPQRAGLTIGNHTSLSLRCLTSLQLSELPTTSSNQRSGVRIHHCSSDPLFHACTDVPPLLCDSVCQMKLISSAPDPQASCSGVSGCTSVLSHVFIGSLYGSSYGRMKQ